jgi:hypothetical protein
MRTDTPAYQAAYYQRRKKSGLCVSCGGQRGPDGTTTICGECRRIRNMKYRDRYRHRTLIPWESLA